MRLLLVGAFSFPHTLGSPVYFREQACALRDAGAEVHLLSYGPPPPALGTDEHGAAGELDLDLDGIEQTFVPAWARPASRRSGPSLGKPVADVALAAALRRLVAGTGPNASPVTSARARASSSASEIASSGAGSVLRRASSAGRSDSGIAFDAILAHHAEAALAALQLLPRRRPPVVYCAHTLLEQELPEYLKSPTSNDLIESTARDARGSTGPAGKRMTQVLTRRALAGVGRVIDRALARRAEAWIALTQSSSRVIGAECRGPGRWIPPPLADLSNDPWRLDPGAIARRFGLVADRFFLYAGNLDPYQDLALLGRVAGARATGSFPLVVATHDDGAHEAGPWSRGLRIVRVRRAVEANALVAAARATIVPRRSIGGFPIKLLNSLVLGKPVVAFHGEEWGLVDGANALVCDPERPAASLLAALGTLEADAALAHRLGAGARATWVASHQPDRAAADTLDLIAKLG